jgi:hypothetical protein
MFRLARALLLNVLFLLCLAATQLAHAATASVHGPPAPSVTFAADTLHQDAITYRVTASWSTSGLTEEDDVLIHATYYWPDGSQAGTPQTGYAFITSSSVSPIDANRNVGYYGRQWVLNNKPNGLGIGTAVYYYEVKVKVYDDLGTIYASDDWNSNSVTMNIGHQG